MKRKKQILIIEDNRSFRRLISHFLSKYYDVISKNNGVAAMHWLKKGNQPDLILLDLGMPEMTGNDFLVGLKSSSFFGDIPVIIISGNNRDTFTKETMNNVLNYFEKPLDPRKLQEKIDQIFTRDTISFSY